MAAKLIQRAKIRARPLFSHVLVWAPRVMLLLLAAYYAYGVALMTGRPIVSDYFLTAVNAPIKSWAEDEVAWQDYARLAKVVQDETVPTAATTPSWAKENRFEMLAVGGERLGLCDTKERPADKQAALEAWLDDHADWFAELRAAAEKPSLGLGIGPPEAFPQAARTAFGYGPPSEDDLWSGSLASSLYPH